MLLLGALDFLFVNHAYHSILTRGASVQLVFGFEVLMGLRWGGKGVQGSSLIPAILLPLSVRHPDDHGSHHLHQIRPTLHRPPEREPLGQQGSLHALH